MADLHASLGNDQVFHPSVTFQARARIKDRAELDSLHQQAAADLAGFWVSLARTSLTWHQPFTQALDESQAPYFKWFADGRFNVSYNCLDRHCADRSLSSQRMAILFSNEQGFRRSLTYEELQRQVCRWANVLKACGVGQGDRVVILLPNIPEAVMAMQACARLGAVHCVVFTGLSAVALRHRMDDAKARLVITADGTLRSGRLIRLKETVDHALKDGGQDVETVLVLKHTGCDVGMQPGRDYFLGPWLAEAAEICPPVWVGGEHPLFILYTSGSTGQPKGIVHSSAGYLVGVMTSLVWVFDLQDEDIMWCTADIGWITGHSYVVYGPLALGGTLVMYEGALTYPAAGRFWDTCQSHRVTILYTSPTALRMLRREGETTPGGYDLSALRLLGSVGEPIHPDLWLWYHHNVGQGRCPVVDTWWQTETGCIVMAPVPGAVATKPGSCTLPLPGLMADIIDEQGESVQRAGQSGALVIKRPWPSMLRGIWGRDDAYKDIYWKACSGQYYIAGDGAWRDEDGYFWIGGRLDDVLNVSGHRLGTAEIEAALTAHPQVTEAAVVGQPDAIKGEAVLAFVVATPRSPLTHGSLEGETYLNGDALRQALRRWVTEQVGSIAKPDAVCFCAALPKTRSGKVMRRLLRSIARDEPIQDDISMLEDPKILRMLQHDYASQRFESQIP